MQTLAKITLGVADGLNVTLKVEKIWVEEVEDAGNFILDANLTLLETQLTLLETKLTLLETG